MRPPPPLLEVTDLRKDAGEPFSSGKSNGWHADTFRSCRDRLEPLGDWKGEINRLFDDDDLMNFIF